MKTPDPKIGDRVNFLTIISEPFKKMTTEKSPIYKYIKAKCECGKEMEVRVSSLKIGRPLSCGCIRNRTYMENQKLHAIQLRASLATASNENRSSNLNRSISY